MYGEFWSNNAYFRKTTIPFKMFNIQVDVVLMNKTKSKPRDLIKMY